MYKEYILYGFMTLATLFALNILFFSFKDSITQKLKTRQNESNGKQKENHLRLLKNIIKNINRNLYSTVLTSEKGHKSLEKVNDILVEIKKFIGNIDLNDEQFLKYFNVLDEKQEFIEVLAETTINSNVVDRLIIDEENLHKVLTNLEDLKKELEEIQENDINSKYGELTSFLGGIKNKVK